MTTMQHNHTNAGLQIYGLCSACDVIYTKRIAEARTKDDDIEIDMDTEAIRERKLL